MMSGGGGCVGKGFASLCGAAQVGARSSLPGRSLAPPSDDTRGRGSGAPAARGHHPRWGVHRDSSGLSSAARRSVESVVTGRSDRPVRRVVTSPGRRSVGTQADGASGEPPVRRPSALSPRSDRMGGYQELELDEARHGLDDALGQRALLPTGRRGAVRPRGRASAGRAARGGGGATAREPLRVGSRVWPERRAELATPAGLSGSARRRRRRHRGAQRRGEPRAQRAG